MRERARKAHGSKPEQDLLEMPKSKFDLEWDENLSPDVDSEDFEDAEIVYDDEVDA